jgi:uncharacterized protein (TIGR02001 family)
MTVRIQRLAGGAAAAAATLMLLAAPAIADGYRPSMKDAPKPEPRRCTLSANVALTTEYVFRGISQTAEQPAVQGGFDVACGIFYAGVWASNLDFGGDAIWGGTGTEDVANIEMDWYLGVKPVTGKINWDFGVIYYSYPGSIDPTGLELDYVELKAGANTEIWKDATIGLTVFYSPDYTLETGSVWTGELAFAQVFPKVSIFTPTFSALLGYQNGDAVSYATLVGNGDSDYWYWNAGLTLGFHEKFSLDFRYWDSSLSQNAGGSGWCEGAIFQCDERFVGTLKFTF